MGYPDTQTALQRADELEADVVSAWPRAWRDLDLVRLEDSGHWPKWCLLPIARGAARVVAQPAADFDGRNAPPPPVGAVAAYYSWRFARTVYTLEPRLVDQLWTSARADLPTLDRFMNLPEWCVHVTGLREHLGADAAYAHLEYNFRSDRPELRLLIDFGQGGLERLLPVTVRLDEVSLASALADYGEVASAVGTVSPSFERTMSGLLSVIDFIASPDARLTNGDQSGRRPERTGRPIRPRTTWYVSEAGSVPPVSAGYVPPAPSVSAPNSDAAPAAGWRLFRGRKQAR
ncbi:hypothetical protein GCM10009765_49580 [Fodinicola feengrottensis]|uniref:Uncharacterized protein n=2 Tax=Fodinicola feengrottensis TaxID=435914 RepID=A0ABP4TWZ2_9ACTN